MGCPRERAAVATVFMALLFLLAGQAGVVSCRPSPTVAVQHQMAAQVRNDLLNNTSTGGNKSRDAAANNATAYAAERTEEAPPRGLCSEEVVVVTQTQGRSSTGSLSNGGTPSYSVTITNNCLGCTVRDIHVSCGEFAPCTGLVDPSEFRRLSYGDCLVKNGGPMAPGDTVSFDYSNSFIYQMDVATVSCGSR